MMMMMMMMVMMMMMMTMMMMVVIMIMMMDGTAEAASHLIRLALERLLGHTQRTCSPSN